ncbi:MAG: hypothetical protein ACRD30_06140 [Bryobacteraceae bacterium]
MKKYIREMIDDLTKRKNKDYVPPAPAVDLDIPPQAALPEDLEDQELSRDPAQRVRQLDFQAQQDEERETIG